MKNHIEQILSGCRLQEWTFSGCQFAVHGVRFATLSLMYTVKPLSNESLEVRTEFRVPEDQIPALDKFLRKYKYKIYRGTRKTPQRKKSCRKNRKVRKLVK